MQTGRKKGRGRERKRSIAIQVHPRWRSVAAMSKYCEDGANMENKKISSADCDIEMT